MGQDDGHERRQSDGRTEWACMWCGARRAEPPAAVQGECACTSPGAANWRRVRPVSKPESVVEPPTLVFDEADTTPPGAVR